MFWRSGAERSIVAMDLKPGGTVAEIGAETVYMVTNISNAVRERVR